MEKKKNQELLETSDDDVFNVEDLFAIQGGEDEDFDEDCYLGVCTLSTNFCVNTKCILLS